jgi:hypothetical protein
LLDVLGRGGGYKKREGLLWALVFGVHEIDWNIALHMRQAVKIHDMLPISRSDGWDPNIEPY